MTDATETTETDVDESDATETGAIDDVHDLIGWEGPGFAVPIERGRIRDFAEATCCEDPVFRDVAEARSRGFADLPAPPTLFGTLFYYERGVHQPELPFESRRTLHGEQSFTYERTPVAGETLYAKIRVVDTFEKPRANGGTLAGVTMETTFRDESGDSVLTAEKTVVEVRTMDDDPEPASDDSGVTSDDSGVTGDDVEVTDDDARSASDDPKSAGDDPESVGDGTRTAYAIGDELPTRSHTVTRQDIARYGGASGDFNRPHVDEPFAIEAGFDSVIAMGMLTAGFGGSAVHEWFGVDALRSYTVRFEDIVYPGEELTVRGSIVDREEGVVVAEVNVVTAAGKEVLSGTVEAQCERADSP